MAGFNGTAATIWAAAAPTTSAKLNAGVKSHGTLPKCEKTAAKATSIAAAANAKPCCTGRMIQGRYNLLGYSVQLKWLCEDVHSCPRKIRELIRDLEKAGFVNRGGKGSHRNYEHPI